MSLTMQRKSRRRTPNKINGAATSTFGYIVAFRVGFSKVVVSGTGAVPKATARTTIPKIIASLLILCTTRPALIHHAYSYRSMSLAKSSFEIISLIGLSAAADWFRTGTLHSVASVGAYMNDSIMDCSFSKRSLWGG